MVPNLTTGSAPETGYDLADPLLSHMFARSSDALLIVNNTTEILHLNAVAANLLGFDCDVPAGIRLRDLVAPATADEDATTTATAIAAAIAQGQSRRFDGISLESCSGGTLPQTELKTLAVDSCATGGEVLVIVACSARQREHQRLELALENGRQGMWEWRPIPDAIEFSDSWYALYGYKNGDIKNVRSDVSNRIHPDDFETARSACIKLLQHPDYDYSVEYRFRHNDGHYIWVMERSIVVERDAKGRASLVVGTHVDISEQKSVEHELITSRRFLNRVLDTIPDRVYWKDLDGRYLGANRQYAIDAGLGDARDIVGLNDSDLPWADNAAAYETDDRDVMRDGAPKLLIERASVDAEGGRHLFETSKVPLFDEAGNTIGLLGISQEITKRRRYELQLEKLAESLTGGSNERVLDALAKGAVELSGTSAAFIAKLDSDGRIATVVSTFPTNDSFSGLCYDVDDSPCSNALESDLCVFPSDVQADFPHDRALADMGISSYVGKRLLNHQGQRIGVFALLDTEPLHDPSYAVSVLDIVAAIAGAELQREQREIAIRESEERYRTIYDNVPVMICTLDEADKVVDINRAWLDATGFAAQETVGTEFSSYLTLPSRRIYAALSREGFPHERVRDTRLDFVRKDGESIKVAYSAARGISPDGAPVTITVLEDVTNQLIAEQQLRLAATAFETHEALVIRDADKRILRVNKAYKAITGYSDTDVVGRLPGYLEHPEHSALEDSEVWRSVELNGEWDGERVSSRADGSTYTAWQTITAVRDGAGETTHYVENFADVSELKRALAEAERLALYDPLTELPNRRYLVEQLESSIALSRRNGTKGALLFIDLDQFKTINDSLGHAVGDALLVQVARRLNRLMRLEDTIARLGGDEFVVVLPGLGEDPVKCSEQTRRVAEKIHVELGRTYEVADHEFIITPTIGATIFPEDGKTVENILQEADSAMYQGKADGRNVTKFFHPSMQSDAQRRLGFERDLRTAVDRGELELYFQPQYDVTGAIFAAEALLRWEHPTRGFVPPGIFVPIAEESGLILELSRWVLGNALNCLRRWERNDTFFLDHLAINVSSRQFRSPSFVRDVIRNLVSAGISTQHVVIEVTEGTVIDNFEETAEKMEELRDIGIRFSVDDFGVGYSSLSYLSRLPLDQLKIDRSFVKNVLEDPNDAVIAETIIGMGRNLHLQTIAEGVENESQLNFLRDKGCDGFQGFLFCKPVPENEFLALHTEQPKIRHRHLRSIK